MGKKTVLAAIALIMLSGAVLASSLKPGEDPAFFLSLGDFLLKNNHATAAAAAYGRALELDPGNAAVYNNLGVLNKDADPEAAVQYFEKALFGNPDYAVARHNLALIYNKLGEFGKAEEHLIVLLLQDPDNINYRYDLAINQANKYYYLSRDIGDLDRSLENFKIVQEMDESFEHSAQNIKVLAEIKMLGE